MRVLAIAVWTFMMMTTAYALFHISFQVDALENQLGSLNHEIRSEQESLHVLSAEWAFLTRPDRLGQLARDVMPGFGPTEPAQLVTFDQLPRPLPEGQLPPGPAAEAVNPNLVRANARRSE